eukprot:SAG31_NODE_314_length_17854_cov_3.932075_17_plen_490_part_00
MKRLGLPPMLRKPVVTVVGSGVLGASVAYHLSRAAAEQLKVVLIDPNPVGSGATARSAGCVLGVSEVPAKCNLVLQTLADIAELGQQLGSGIGFRQTGSLRLAADQHDLELLAKAADVTNEACARWGILEPTARLLDSADAGKRSPWLRAEGGDSVVGGAYCAVDGIVDPSVLASSYQRAARATGAVTVRNAAVAGFVSSGTQIEGVKLQGDQGVLHCDHVVNAAGAWAGPLLAGLPGSPFESGLPYAPTRSHYWVAPNAPSELFCGDGNSAVPTWPVTIIPQARAYCRMEGTAGALLGLQEEVSLSWDPRTLGLSAGGGGAEGLQGGDAAAQAEEALLSQFETIAQYFPGVAVAEWRHYVAGLSTYTIDGEYLAGPLPGVEGVSVVTGCNGSGLSSAGGLGRLVASEVLRNLELDDKVLHTAARTTTDGLTDIDPRVVFGGDRFSLARFTAEEISSWEESGCGGVNSPEFRARCAARRGAKFQRKSKE